MLFLKKLFGGGSGTSSGGGKPIAEIEHEGYLIKTTPMAAGGQFRVCGTISKEIDGEIKEHMLIRADTLPDANAASDMTLQKAKQMIKEQGDLIFRD